MLRLTLARARPSRLGVGAILEYMPRLTADDIDTLVVPEREPFSLYRIMEVDLPGYTLVENVLALALHPDTPFRMPAYKLMRPSMKHVAALRSLCERSNRLAPGSYARQHAIVATPESVPTLNAEGDVVRTPSYRNAIVRIEGFNEDLQLYRCRPHGRTMRWQLPYEHLAPATEEQCTIYARKDA